MKAFVGLGLLVMAADAISQVTNFDADVVGQAPTGWTCGATGFGKPGWSVTSDGSAPSPPNVLKQAGVATYPWCVKDDAVATDGAVEVKFKPVSGKEDQAGGVVWRWKDGDNYYVARANALENNVSLYYTVGGARRTIVYKNAPVAPNAWHSLRVVYKGALIQVSLDGKLYITVEDGHIAGPGKAGVWTKADSVTLFDDFSHSASAAK
jgi:hypothetical protein